MPVENMPSYTKQDANFFRPTRIYIDESAILVLAVRKKACLTGGPFSFPEPFDFVRPF
jgi:hypothetical protein